MSWDLYEAFGERKTTHAWAQDPRCRLSREALRRRLLKGWPMEQALTTPAKGSRHYPAFGETMTLQEWAQDPRCQVSQKTLRQRLLKGSPMEQALTTPLRRGGIPREVYTAWGEAKSLSAWARDPRCRVSLQTLKMRVTSSMPLEQALTSPANRARTTQPAYTAFGERKSLHAWTRDPRCQVSGMTLRQRLLKGWPMEQALTTPASKPGGRAPVRHTAWGEAKSLSAWARDPRCEVSVLTLRARLTGGMPLSTVHRELAGHGSGVRGCREDRAGGGR